MWNDALLAVELFCWKTDTGQNSQNTDCGALVESNNKKDVNGYRIIFYGVVFALGAFQHWNIVKGHCCLHIFPKGDNDDKAWVDTVRVLQQLGEVVVRHTGDEALSGSPSSRQDPPPPPSSLPPSLSPPCKAQFTIICLQTMSRLLLKLLEFWKF